MRWALEVLMYLGGKVRITIRPSVLRVRRINASLSYRGDDSQLSSLLARVTASKGDLKLRHFPFYGISTGLP